MQDQAHKAADALAATSFVSGIAANVPLITEWLQLVAAVIGILSGLAALRFYLKRTKALEDDRQ